VNGEGALCYLETFLMRRKLPSLLDKMYSNRIRELSMDGFLEAMRSSQIYYQRGDARFALRES
jgi:hypothetical protein